MNAPARQKYSLKMQRFCHSLKENHDDDSFHRESSGRISHSDSGVIIGE
jgi:hypothetical protein